ncbi:MAG: thiolase family protein [Acidiferrobacterales bacterium]
MAAQANDRRVKSQGDGARPLILGGGAVAFRRYDDGSGYRDWVRAAARAAIADVGIEPADVDAVIVASESDFFSLQVAPAAVLLDDIGLVPRAVMRVESGGASGANALRAGVMHIMSGQAGCVLVVGFEQTASHLAGDDVRLIYALSFDADIDGMAGATAMNLYALSMQEHMARFGTNAEQMAHVSVKNHGNARANPWAHRPMQLTIADVLASPMVSQPYHLLDCSMISDGAAAVVLSHPARAPSSARPRVRIAGSGCASDYVRLGDRADRHRFTAKALSSRAAYEMAGITDPAKQIDVAEVYDAFSGAEIQGIEALGLSPEGHGASAIAGGDFDGDGRLPVNLSGGLIGQGGAPGATGIVQALTIERLLTGRYWEGAQPTRDLRLGLIDAHGGICTLSVTHVLERID